MESLKALKQELCAIEIGPEGIAVAHLPTTASLEGITCKFYPCQLGNQVNSGLLREQLSQIVAEHHLQKVQCNWVLHPHHYRLTLVNIPNVPPTEYKKAIRWQIKDIITHALEDTAIEIFYPDEPERTSKKVHVIAAQQSFLHDISILIRDCELNLSTIDIREFAARNLVAKIAKPNEVIGILNIVNDNCLIAFIKQTNLQFVRRFPISLLELKNGNYSDLTTEIQRSFSYCQTELKQTIPTKLLLSPNIEPDKNMAQNLTQHLNLETASFSLPEIVHFNQPIDSKTEARCWPAVGGVLRNSIQEPQP